MKKILVCTMVFAFALSFNQVIAQRTNYKAPVKFSKDYTKVDSKSNQYDWKTRKQISKADWKKAKKEWQGKKASSRAENASCGNGSSNNYRKNTGTVSNSRKAGTHKIEKQNQIGKETSRRTNPAATKYPTKTKTKAQVKSRKG